MWVCVRSYSMKTSHLISEQRLLWVVTSATGWLRILSTTTMDIAIVIYSMAKWHTGAARWPVCRRARGGGGGAPTRGTRRGRRARGTCRGAPRTAAAARDAPGSAPVAGAAGRRRRRTGKGTGQTGQEAQVDGTVAASWTRAEAAAEQRAGGRRRHRHRWHRRRHDRVTVAVAAVAAVAAAHSQSARGRRDSRRTEGARAPRLPSDRFWDSSWKTGTGSSGRTRALTLDSGVDCWVHLQSETRSRNWKKARAKSSRSGSWAAI